MFKKTGRVDPGGVFLSAGDGYDDTNADFYRHVIERKLSVIVTAGSRKMAALRPGLDARLFNMLVTDAVTAKTLLDK